MIFGGACGRELSSGWIRISNRWMVGHFLYWGFFVGSFSGSKSIVEKSFLCHHLILCVGRCVRIMPNGRDHSRWISLDQIKVEWNCIFRNCAGAKGNTLFVEHQERTWRMEWENFEKWLLCITLLGFSARMRIGLKGAAASRQWTDITMEKRNGHGAAVGTSFTITRWRWSKE